MAIESSCDPHSVCTCSQSNAQSTSSTLTFIMGGSPSKDALQMASRDWNGAGQVAIVTGPMGTGIGFHTARWLAERGTHVILAGRSAERLQGCVEQLRAACKGADGSALPADQVQLTPLVLDLSSLQSVEEFAANFQALNLPLKMLICNAGIMATPYQQTKDGFEIQFGTNHLGHFRQQFNCTHPGSGCADGLDAL